MQFCQESQPRRLNDSGAAGWSSIIPHGPCDRFRSTKPPRYIRAVSIKGAKFEEPTLHYTELSPDRFKLLAIMRSAGHRDSLRVVCARARCVSSMVRGAPARCSSQRPSSRCSAKRRRHLPTVSGSIPRRAATTLLCSPSTQARMIRARSAKPCAVLRRASTHRHFLPKICWSAIIESVWSPPNY